MNINVNISGFCCGVFCLNNAQSWCTKYFALQQDANMCEEGSMQESIKTYQIYPFLSALQKRKQKQKHTALKCVIIFSCLWMSVAVLSMLIPLLKSRSLDSSVRLDQIIYPSIYPLILYCIFVYICSFIYVTICQPASLSADMQLSMVLHRICVFVHTSVST